MLGSTLTHFGTNIMNAINNLAKMLKQVNMTSMQSKNKEITTLLQQISQEQDWGEPIDEGLAEAAKNLWHAKIANDKLKDYVENDKI